MGDIDERLAAARARVEQQAARLRSLLQRSKATGARASATGDSALDRLFHVQGYRGLEPPAPSYVPDQMPDLAAPPAAQVGHVEQYPSVAAFEAGRRALAVAGWHLHSAGHQPDGTVRAVFVR